MSIGSVPSDKSLNAFTNNLLIRHIYSFAGINTSYSLSVSEKNGYWIVFNGSPNFISCFNSTASSSVSHLSLLIMAGEEGIEPSS